MSGFYDHPIPGYRPDAHEIYSAHRPRKGDPITYKGVVTGKVHRVEGNLCWNAYADGSEPLPFIWAFKDGLNNLHDWPTKGKPDDIPKIEPEFHGPNCPCTMCT